MQHSRLTTKILMQMEKLISDSLTATGDPRDGYREFHVALLKHHYKAACATIDYNRHRIKMDVIIDDSTKGHNLFNLVFTTTPVNIFYKNLQDFLISCFEIDIKSLALYSKLIQTYADRSTAIAV